MPCRDSSPQPDTRNSCGVPGNVFENPSASDEPTASCSGNVYARSPTATLGEPVFLNTGRSEARVDQMERNTKSFTIPTPRFAGTVSTWNPPSLAEGAYPQNLWLSNRGIRSRKCISISAPYFRRFTVEKRASRPRYVLVLTFLRKLCVGSKKWKWSIRWTISRRPNQFEDIDSLILRRWMRRLRPP